MDAPWRPDQRSEKHPSQIVSIFKGKDITLDITLEELVWLMRVKDHIRRIREKNLVILRSSNMLGNEEY